MQSDEFYIGHFDGRRYWLAHEGDGLIVCMESDAKEGCEIIGKLSREKAANLMRWISPQTTVTTVFDGPMAAQIKASSESLGLPEGSIVWNAVKLFLDVGEAN